MFPVLAVTWAIGVLELKSLFGRMKSLKHAVCF